MSTLSDWCNAMTLEHLLQYRTLRSVSEILIHSSDVVTLSWRQAHYVIDDATIRRRNRRNLRAQAI